VTSVVDEPVWEIRVVRAAAVRTHTRMVRVPVTHDADSKILFPGQELSGSWKGSYDELKQDRLTVRVWYYQKWGPNIFIGEAYEELATVADDTSARELIILKRAQRGLRARKQEVATVSFRFQLEEIFHWDLKFQDWTVRGIQPKQPHGDGCLAQLARLAFCATRGDTPLYHHALEFQMPPSTCFRRILCCGRFVRDHVWLTNGHSR
jgi:hypothetical protein